jgi:ATP-dependent helicase HrpA
LGSRDKILDQLINTSYVVAFDLENGSPANKLEFEARFNANASNLLETADKVESLLYQIMTEYDLILKALKLKSSLADYALCNDVKNQLNNLIYEDFLFLTPWVNLKSFPRYLKAINARLEKYPRQIQKDKESCESLAMYWERYRDRKEFCDRQEIVEKELELFRWMLEEYRVSLFAQTLGTQYPVSEKRLQRSWQKLGTS